MNGNHFLLIFNNMVWCQNFHVLRTILIFIHVPISIKAIETGQIMILSFFRAALVKFTDGHTHTLYRFVDTQNYKTIDPKHAKKNVSKNRKIIQQRQLQQQIFTGLAEVSKNIHPNGMWWRVKEWKWKKIILHVIWVVRNAISFSLYVLTFMFVIFKFMHR